MSCHCQPPDCSKTPCPPSRHTDPFHGRQRDSQPPPPLSRLSLGPLRSEGGEGGRRRARQMKNLRSLSTAFWLTRGGVTFFTAVCLGGTLGSGGRYLVECIFTSLNDQGRRAEFNNPLTAAAEARMPSVFERNFGYGIRVKVIGGGVFLAVGKSVMQFTPFRTLSYGRTTGHYKGKGQSSKMLNSATQ